MSDNGWTDDFLCKEWFKNNFIPQVTACNTSQKPILLIYDGHVLQDASVEDRPGALSLLRSADCDCLRLVEFRLDLDLCLCSVMD